MLNTIINHYLHSLKNTFNYKGRATRTELCWFSVISGLLFILLLHTALVTNIYLTYFILSAIRKLYSFIIIFPSISLVVRRLHDLGKSGWWLSAVAIPFFGSFFFYALAVIKLDDSYGTDNYDEKTVFLYMGAFLFIAFISFILSLFLYFKGSQKSPNKWGDCPTTYIKNK
ncbi:DUF805 domain-containing protein [Pasteurella atlantica]|uniref:DUF805 domain-containing protein n=2 Tax=Pasteurellaceae TaxID=712 RepID=A0ACC6HN91_9PAST|nr:DUF805 domain-containing protein [Pasteurella atlantica]MDP8033485.1 DUF805 domain-containing protein [Pasteurella atlantica]MDP8035421.1 DUF805 domain-containing protein [Pasteurella atlantica]MDP8037372.1 DUF805 domain-containing protein [Pasteurella atlantica]MDP8047720.1 DUF805 domain-containing protein [Pasteurella atlantica]MDP8049719.1 DUF805 domain-containing protein [Pasteurella atlantica]